MSTITTATAPERREQRRAPLARIRWGRVGAYLLLGIFAGIAVMLVAVGLYAMLSQFVSERTREIGVRLALGARPPRILADVLGQTTAIVAGGIGAGLVAALLLARFVAGLVYGISPRDPVTLIGVTALLAAVAAVAALPAAWRAAAMNPLAALRSE